MCVRPQTFEDAEESEVLESIFDGRNGLQNTVFALLSPKGIKVSFGSRSPGMTYGSVEEFLTALDGTAERYTKTAKEIEALPVHRDLRVALNVAAADLRPLVVVRGADARETKALREQVAEAAWNEAAVGRFHYVVLAEETAVGELTPEVGVSVVEPEPYGRGGEVLSHTEADAKVKAIAKALGEGLAAHDPGEKDYEKHVRKGKRDSIRWESEVPSTDVRGQGARRERR